jgi:para-aminobenzoate synthetase/4-amino-4-deoxychorismate lyase
MSALFPCASITGAPKVRTAGIISDLEATARGLYTGSIGFIGPGPRAQFNVAIRTAVIDRVKEWAFYGTGGGIVWDSTRQDEYTEAILKSRVLTEQQPEFSLLETLLWTRGDGYFLIDYHMKRLADSACYFDYALNIEDIEEALHTKANNFTEETQKIRLLIDRNGSIVIQSSVIDLDETPEKLRVRLATEPVHSKNIFLYHKTTFRSVYETARQSCPGCDDVLLWNEREELTESSIANIVMEMDGELYTPPVRSGLLAGIFRAWLLDQGKVKERILRVADLQSCKRLYLINSVRKWQEAELIGG